jgi:hypothetical protein
MQHDPFYLKTKSEFDDWRKNKKHKTEHIPEKIRENIRTLCSKYPKSKIASSFSLSPSSFISINRIKTNGIEKKTITKKASAQFFEIPSASTNNVNIHSAVLKIELELPMNIKLRFYQ